MEEFYAWELEGYYKNIQMNLPVLYYEGCYRICICVKGYCNKTFMHSV